tara:strand:- start:4347 stop:5309 length:963 start_codon:yes stop_codon:yes gene_type:complete
MIAVLGACATTAPQQLDIIARDDSFALLRIAQGQTADDLARALYGHQGERWQLDEANPGHSFAAGEVVAAPLKPLNISGVYPDGYRVLPILCYHQFRQTGATEHRLELSAAAFEQQLKYLRDNHFITLSLDDVAAILRDEKPIPEKAVVITIDDGYRSVYDVAYPLLKKYAAKATLFLYTDFIGAGKALNWQQVNEMARSELIDIESHAKSHTSLARLPQDSDEASYRLRLQQEYAGSQAAFKRHSGAAPRYLSYPYGDSSELAATLADTHNYVLAATVTRGDNTSATDPFLLHRTMIYDTHSLPQFARLLRTFRQADLQ